MKINFIMEYKKFCDQQYLRKHPSAGSDVLKENFKKVFSNYIQRKQKVLLNDMKDFFDISKEGKKSRSIMNGDEEMAKLSIEVLDKDKRKAKADFQAKALDTIVDAVCELSRQEDHYLNTYNIENRNTKAFLYGIETNNVFLQKDAFINELKNDKEDPALKKALFNQYMQDGFQQYDNLKKPENDAEALSNFKNILFMGQFFSIDDVGPVYNILSNDNLDQNTTNLWKEKVRYNMNITSYAKSVIDKYTNPLYSYFDDKSLAKFGRTLNEYSTELNYRDKIIDIPGFDTSDDPTSLVTMGNYVPSLQDVGGKNYSIASNILGLGEDSEAYLADGQSPNEEGLNQALKDNKEIYLFGNQGQKYILRNQESGFLKISPIREIEYPKDIYKRSLKILNSETHFFIHSSDEYRNMRNILGQLVEGNGNEFELLKQMDDNIKKYETNYFFKANKSNIATKRYNCVRAIKDGIYALLDNKKFEDFENRMFNANEQENVQENVIINSENQRNSTTEYYQNQMNNNDLSLDNSNEMENDEVNNSFSSSADD